MSKVVYPELSYRVMAAVFEVHNTLGPGFVESIYERALAHELASQGIPFERQMTVTVRYKGETVGKHVLDLVIDGKILLELKAVSALDDAFRQQTLSYLKATGIKLGILINFGTPRVEYERIVNSQSGMVQRYGSTFVEPRIARILSLIFVEFAHSCHS